ncbi:hypothetical protein ACHAPY_011587 [Fusarium culmorum]
MSLAADSMDTQYDASREGTRPAVINITPCAQCAEFVVNRAEFLTPNEASCCAAVTNGGKCPRCLSIGLPCRQIQDERIRYNAKQMYMSALTFFMDRNLYWAHEFFYYKKKVSECS